MIAENLNTIAVFAAIQAGRSIMDVYSLKDFKIKIKSDNSPLTIADKISHDIITKSLKKSGIPILSEEGKNIPYDLRKNWEYFWMVDPLDGTKEFINRNGEFTVNIALINNTKPILGVIYVPVSKELFFASEGKGAFKVPDISGIKDLESGLDGLLSTRGIKLPKKHKKKNFTVVGSRSHMNKETEEYISVLKSEYGNVEIVSKGSSLKFCLVAEGVADIYPRFGPTMEWDTAAGHAIAHESGRIVLRHNSDAEMDYNKENLLNPWFIVKSGN